MRKILPQKFEPRGARARARREKILKILTPLRLLVWAFFCCSLSCQSTPVDLRALAPADALVYLETRDLGKTLKTLTENRAFEQLAKNKTDFSALEKMQVAVSVTGFEASENQVTTENSVLNFKPRFVAVAETHAWNWQTRSFVENRLGEFVNETYGGEVTLDATDKAGGKSYVWTAKDGRKAHAFVKDSKVFFSNDETALEKALAVFRGEAESLAKSGKNFQRAENPLAFGYVSADGVAQISNLAGVSTALEATDEEEGRSFIARVLPQILRNAVKEIFWTAVATEQGIEDKYEIQLAPESAAVLKETLAAPALGPSNAAEFLPADLQTVTRYNLQNPQIAWRSLLLVAGKNSDAVSANVIVAFSGSLLDPYGVSDAEIFMSAIDAQLWTVNLDAEGEKTVALVSVKDAEAVKKSVSEINFKAAAEKLHNADVWKSEDGETAAAFVENKLLLGEREAVIKCLEARESGQNFTKNPLFQRFNESKLVAVTIGKDATEKVVEVLGEKKDANLQMTTNYLTETRFHDKGIERRTVSPFGLIGRILEQFAD